MFNWTQVADVIKFYLWKENFLPMSKNATAKITEHMHTAPKKRLDNILG